jgi:ribosomal-protein-alanine N-acetyltransferase
MIAIEPIDRRHRVSIQEIISDPELARTTDIPSPLPPDAAGGWIARMKSLEEKGTGFTFVILADNRVVGACGLYRVDSERKTADLGFFVGTPYWGRGYATAASRVLLARGFTVMGLCSVQAGCLAWNIGATRVLTKLGFQPSHEGPPPPGSKFRETERHRYWSMTREQWAAARDTVSIPYPGKARR